MTKKNSIRAFFTSDVMQVKNILITAFVICLLGGIIGMFFVSPLKWWVGIIFGFVINCLCFRLLYLDTKKIIGYTEKQAKFTAFTSYFVRYIIKGAAMYASIKSEYLSLGSCLIGLLSINAAIHVLNILNIQFAKTKEGRD